jgi:SAM-dependent methyltransferase
MSHWRGLSLVCPRCRGELFARPRGAACRQCDAEYAEQQGVLELVAGGSGTPGFDPHFFSTLREVEDRHFWFVGRRQVVLAALRRAVPDLASRRLFDVGCGSGGLLAFLSRSGIEVAGACDVYPESLRLVRARLDVPLVLVDEGRRLPLGRGYDLLGMFDVLEHIDDDVGALRTLRESLAPGGALVLTVPAHQRLYDEMDEIAFHRRRYERASLRGVLEESGFEVRLLSHFMSPLVPILVLIRSAGKRLHGGRSGVLQRRRAEFRVVPGVNALMRGVLALERAAMVRARVPFGSSLVAVAVRGR